MRILISVTFIVAVLAQPILPAQTGAGPKVGASIFVPPMASSLEAVPVPNVAKPDNPNPKPLRDSIQHAQYRVPGMRFQTLRAWYDVHLPIERPWRQCELSEGKMYVQRMYHRPPSSTSLSVTITRDDPPGILISLDEIGGEC